VNGWAEEDACPAVDGAPDARKRGRMSKPVCAVVGVGPGNGAAFARRFSDEGFAVALLARKLDFTSELAAALPSAKAFACDVSDVGSIKRAFDAIRQDLGEVDVVLYNAGSGVWGTVEEVTPSDLETAFRVNTSGLLASVQEVLPAMKAKKRGSIVVIGATASRRGGAKTAAFAPAKAAQRSLAESMARHLWPAGIHVSLIVVDGVIDLATTRQRMKDKPESFFVKAADIAATAFWLTKQEPSAWSFEVEARPFAETW
jgi:NAD(P)-dependent dehydrogenase (short-subunit alcohol dehydrogenase family)